MARIINNLSKADTIETFREIRDEIKQLYDDMLLFSHADDPILKNINRAYDAILACSSNLPKDNSTSNEQFEYQKEQALISLKAANDACIIKKKFYDSIV